MHEWKCHFWQMVLLMVSFRFEWNFQQENDSIEPNQMTDTASFACMLLRSMALDSGWDAWEIVCLNTRIAQKLSRKILCLCAWQGSSFQSPITKSAAVGPWNVESRHCPRCIDAQSFAALRGWPCRHWIQVHGWGRHAKGFCFDAIKYVIWVWYDFIVWTDTWYVYDTLWPCIQRALTVQYCWADPVHVWEVHGV